MYLWIRENHLIQKGESMPFAGQETEPLWVKVFKVSETPEMVQAERGREGGWDALEVLPPLPVALALLLVLGVPAPLPAPALPFIPLPAPAFLPVLPSILGTTIPASMASLRKLLPPLPWPAFCQMTLPLPPQWFQPWCQTSASLHSVVAALVVTSAPHPSLFGSPGSITYP